jgi:hypothetical protein
MQHDAHGKGSYGGLAAMTGLSFVAMYLLMYAMVNTFENVFNSINEVYMAGLMSAPMLLIELALMARMYPVRRLNILFVGVGVLIMLGCWFGIRQQIAVSDQQFLRSMIPHHAGAILMCTRNTLRDPELQALCGEIIRSQQAEIDLMKTKLR